MMAFILLSWCDFQFVTDSVRGDDMSASHAWVMGSRSRSEMRSNEKDMKDSIQLLTGIQ